MKKTGIVTVDETKIDVFDVGEPTVFVDFITELNDFNGIVRISLASGYRDEAGQIEARVQCRLRMTLGTAFNLRNALSHLIGAENLPDSAKN